MGLLGHECTEWLLLTATFVTLLLHSTRHLTGETSRCGLRDAFLGKALGNCEAIESIEAAKTKTDRASITGNSHTPRAHDILQHSNFVECKRRLWPGIAVSGQPANRVMSL